MSKFKFVSPGVQVDEIDNSHLPQVGGDIGPVVIGRAQRGPGMRPVKLSSFSEFIEIFGNPSAGGVGGDVWRNGNNTAPTYGAYAAQAWLKNQNSLTYVRLLGREHDDATEAGKAGWKVGSLSTGRTGGAFGLLVFPSASAGTAVTGALAAVWYLTTGSVVMSGTLRGGDEAEGSAALFEAPSKEFKVTIKNASGDAVTTKTFNFTPSSDKFIRKVFNTNPTLTNSDIVADSTNYWLGETFETHMSDVFSSASAWQGAIVALKHGDGNFEHNSFQHEAQASQTGWFFSQDLNSETGSFDARAMTNLFRFHSLDSGEWNQNNIKISIKDIKVSSNEFDPFGTFTVEIRKMDDDDGHVVVYETFTMCNLNRNSPNYIARKIGDKYVQFDSTTRRNVEYGEFDNLSKFIRVEVAADVDAGTVEPSLLPFGVYGPVRYDGFTVLSGTETTYEFGSTTEIFVPAVQGADNLPDSLATDGFLEVGDEAFTGSVLFPALGLRHSTATGSLSSPTKAYFGVYTNNTSGKKDKSLNDLVRIKPVGVDSFAESSDNATEYSFVFTLDDVKYVDGSTTDAEWVEGSRVSGESITAVSGGFSSVLEAGFNRFTTVLAGGFDGFDITEKEPFRNTAMDGASETTSYAYNSIKEVIDIISDPFELEFKAAALPGITTEGLTGHLLSVCEERGDAIAVIDLRGDYQPSTENAGSEASRLGSVATTIANLKNRGISNSYGAAYYPWVQVKDNINDTVLWVPPSTVVLGVYASTDKTAAPWFSPAGFVRGGLTAGKAGLPVTGVRQKLSKAEMDALYSANINPIASFPNQGIVVWGQKTLQVVPSALDRVNVRRLLIDVKTEILRMAAQTVFEPNIRDTWDNFKREAEPYLDDVVSKFGLEEYRLILDESTTTPDLVDRNVIYAKCALRPTKSAEYFQIDFSIESSGASFDD